MTITREQLEEIFDSSIRLLEGLALITPNKYDDMGVQAIKHFRDQILGLFGDEAETADLSPEERETIEKAAAEFKAEFNIADP